MREIEIIVNEEYVETVSVDDFFIFSVKYHNLSSTADTIHESERVIIHQSTTGIWLIGDNELLIGEDGNLRDISKELSFFLEWQNPDSIHSPISLKMLFYAIVDSLKHDSWKSFDSYQGHSIRISEIAQHYSKRAIREEQKSIQKELNRVILEDLKRDFINRAKKKLEPTPEDRKKRMEENHKRLNALLVGNGVRNQKQEEAIARREGERKATTPTRARTSLEREHISYKKWSELTEEDKSLILPVFEGMTEDEVQKYWDSISPTDRELSMSCK